MARRASQVMKGVAAMADESDRVYPTGLTPKEAEEIQNGLMWGTRIYAAIAILAHILAYMLTPWLK
jgi:light-harvesting protein B-800-850 beta chain